MGRNRHDSACTISGQYIVANPYGNGVAGERVDSIRTTEYAGYTAVGDAFAFGTFLGAVQISVHFFFLFRSGKLGDQFAFGCQYHEGYTEHGICTSSEDSEFDIAVFYFKLYVRTFRTANPVALGFFQ